MGQISAKQANEAPNSPEVRWHWWQFGLFMDRLLPFWN